jgi:hypothetical protein
MRRFGTLSAGSSAALLILALAVVCSRPAGAQDAPPPSAGSNAPITSNPAPPLPQVSGTSTAPPPAPLNGGTVVPPPAVPSGGDPLRSSQPTRREQLKSKTIDQVMTRLAAIKDQQAELEKEKKEAETVLKEKLKEQREKLKKLGVNVDENDRPPAKVSVVPPSVGGGHSY